MGFTKAYVDTRENLGKDIINIIEARKRKEHHEGRVDRKNGKEN
jgi:hypothetical protein